MNRSLGLAVSLCLLLAAAAATVSSPALGARATTVQCGQVITEDTKLASDLSGCTGSGLIIAADNVTLDLNGHIVTGDNDFDESEEAGVQIHGIDGAVIKNGTIADFVHVVNAGDFGPANDAVIRNITGDGILGLVFLVGDRNRIERNTFTGGGDSGLFVTGNENVVFKNSIVGDWEIPVAVHGDGNRITHNFIRGEEHCQALFGVTGNGNVVRHNDASGGGFCAFPPGLAGAHTGRWKSPPHLLHTP